MVHAAPRVGRPTFKEEEERVDTDWVEVYNPHLKTYSSGYCQVEIQGVSKVEVQGNGKVLVQGVGHCAEVKSQGAKAGGVWSTMMVVVLCFFIVRVPKGREKHQGCWTTSRDSSR